MNNIKKILFFIPLLLQVGGQAWMLMQVEFLPIIHIENAFLWICYYVFSFLLSIYGQILYYIAGTLIMGLICAVPYVIDLYFNKRTPGKERWMWLIPILGFGFAGQAAYYFIQIARSDRPIDSLGTENGTEKPEV